jgi:hypothetical protein
MGSLHIQVEILTWQTSNRCPCPSSICTRVQDRNGIDLSIRYSQLPLNGKDDLLSPRLETCMIEAAIMRGIFKWRGFFGVDI